jgi:hypothetical protein
MRRKACRYVLFSETDAKGQQSKLRLGTKGKDDSRNYTDYLQARKKVGTEV